MNMDITIMMFPWSNKILVTNEVIPPVSYVSGDAERLLFQLRLKNLFESINKHRNKKAKARRLDASRLLHGEWEAGQKRFAIPLPSRPIDDRTRYIGRPLIPKNG